MTTTSQKIKSIAPEVLPPSEIGIDCGAEFVVLVYSVGGCHYAVFPPLG